jgi:hypothetical protein
MQSGSFARTTGKRRRTKDDDEDDWAIKTADCLYRSDQSSGQYCYAAGKHFFPG